MFKLNMPEDAQAWAERAYEIVRSQPDKEYTSEAGIVYMTMGNISCQVAGHVSEAKICFKKALPIYIKVVGKNGSDTKLGYHNIEEAKKCLFTLVELIIALICILFSSAGSL